MAEAPGWNSPTPASIGKAACDGNSECVAFKFEPATKERELAKAVDLQASVADGVADGGDGR